MNMKLVGVVLAVSGLGLVACGDSTGTGTGSGGGGTGGGATTSAGGGGTGGADCESTCYAAHQEGYSLLQTEVTNACGCDQGGTGGGGGGTATPCATECAADTGCATDPPVPSGACLSCIGDKIEASDGCALNPALGPECQGNTDCAALVMCVLEC